MAELHESKRTGVCGAASRRRALLAGAAVAPLLFLGGARAQATFPLFESGPVRPLARSADGTRLFVANIPDARLEILRVDRGTLTPLASVPVGLEPVAVAVRDESEVWVVNHLSDSVSIVDLSGPAPHVSRTLWVGDEPRDIVFAGPDRSRAFVTAAHRGQNVPFDPQLTTPGVGRADVWVFDADHLGESDGGEPLTIVTLFGDTPRALAVSPDGAIVYAAVFHSGNQTTALNEELVCNGGTDAACSVDGIVMPGGLPGPPTNATGAPRPETGLIVRYDPAGGAWRDSLDRDWSDAVRFDLPDYDVFAIDATASLPAEMDRWAHVGTTLFNIAVHPVSGALYVSNTEARNEVRFEGPGITGGSTVRGHLHEARITVIDPQSGDVEAHRLNPHIDYDTVPSPAGTRELSLATPLDMAVDASGATLYVAAFGSGAIGVVDTRELASGTRVPSKDTRIELRGGGPCGLALSPDESRLYVLTRFDNTVSVVDLATRRETQRLALHNPEPPTVTEGRRFLYDASLDSSNGEASCSSCHVFGDVDELAWDLGDPDAEVVRLGGISFHPMKGPMGVQTLRGLAGHGPMHWRGERNGGVVPGGDRMDERAAFSQFNSAFVDLLGRAQPLDRVEMESYTDFVLRILPPPNPIRSLDNRLDDAQQRGRNLYFNTTITCAGCHSLVPQQGLFGTNGTQTPALETQEFKTPQLRNLYQRVGMFGLPPIRMFGGSGIDTEHQGEQIRGFGFLHDGSLDTLFRFLSADIFALNDGQRRDIESFLLAFDANLAPIVGQQWTAPSGAVAAAPRFALLRERARAGECDLVAHGVSDGLVRGWTYRAGVDRFEADRVAEPAVDPAALLAAAAPLTFTCVPPGSGNRAGIDRDEDGLRDRDEIDQGSDPADPASPSALCAGDCDRSGGVSIAELIRGVSIALGNAPLSSCSGIDADGDERVAVAELIAAVRHALLACA